MGGASLGTALLLLLGGVVILFIELFVPSAGLLFVVATVCIIGSVVAAFMVSPALGWTFVVIVLVLVCVLPWLFLELWKRTPIGKYMLMDAGTQTTAAASEANIVFGDLVGKLGKTITPLRPSGICDFNGRRIDTVSEGVMIERGEWVRVIDVQGNRVIVRKTSEQPKAPDFDFESIND